MSKKKAPAKGRTKATSAKAETADDGNSEHLAGVPQASLQRLPERERRSATSSAESEKLESESLELPVIVGIGSSAGGLNAVGDLLRHLPAETKMAFVVVQHLDPHHESAMAELLSRETSLPVTELTDGTRPKPNHVYIIAPNRKLVFARGLLQLEPRVEGPGYYMPIDRFFRSLAETQGPRAVGIVLSGSGSDGVIGLQAIKAEGGITFAQDESATHGGMPRSAVAAGCVDFVLPPEKIAEELHRISRHEYLNGSSHGAAPAADADAEHGFQDVVRYLQITCGVDFEHYKRPTLRRRIERRMLLRHFSTLSDYLTCLHDDRGEVDALCQDIFIHVTSFFRDADVLEFVKKTAFPRITENRPFDTPIRIWVPGCSTGEEVYSLAILMLEYLEEGGLRTPIKIFATDVSETAISKARTGIYLANMVAEVSPERLRKYFVKCEEGHQIAKSVRDMCVFARHDVTKDPPFSQLDLISCRNVMIYLGPVLQQRVLLAFHYGLKPGGFLLLGGSESIGTFGESFEPVDKHFRLYSTKQGRTRSRIDFSAGAMAAADTAVASSLAAHLSARPDVQKEADRLLLAKYAPVGVVVDDSNQVVQFRGQTGRFLQPPAGSPSVDVLKMAREGLLVDLRRALDSARQTHSVVRKEGLRVKTNDHFATVNLEVIPVAAPSNGQRHYLVLFEEPEARAKPAAEPPAARPPKVRVKQTAGADREIARLHEELNGTKSYLQSIVEGYEASNEELKAANEEIISSNEELQSTSEELETAKEELQATNEELTTINDELQSRVIVAGQLNDDLKNLIESINIPIAILDRDLKLRRFTPAAQRLLNLIPSDIGRPITDLRPRIDIPDWDPLLREVQETLAVQHREVRDDAGRWYEMTIRPYKTQENKISGTVVTLVDIDELKRSELAIIGARDYADSIVETAPAPILVLDPEFRVRTANRTFCQKYVIDPIEARKQHVFSLSEGAWNFPRLRELLAQVRDHGRGFDKVEVRLELPRVGGRTILLTGRAMGSAHDGKPEFILLAIEDITERRRGEAMQDVQHKSIRILAAAENLNEATSKLLHVLVDALEFEFGHVWMRDDTHGRLKCSDYYTRGVMDSAEFERYCHSTNLAPGEGLPGLIFEKQAPVWIDDLASEDVKKNPEFANLKLKSAAGFPIVWRDKVFGVIALYSRHYREPNEMTLRELGDLSTQTADFIERDHAKTALRESEVRLRAIVETAAQAIITLDERGSIESINQAGAAMFGYAAEDAIGRDISQLIPSPFGIDQTAAPEPFSSRLHRLNRPNSEGLGRHTTGRTFPILVAVSQATLSRGQLYVAIVHDMSALKEAESRAIQGQRLAVIGELSAGLAHESRNALQRSQSCLEMLLHEVRDRPKAQELVDRIQKAQDYLLQLYEGVRNYAAPIHLERARINLAEVAQNVWNEIDSIRNRPGARLTLQREGVDSHCFADAMRISQVFRNLFENALAAASDPCKVTVSFSEAEIEGRPALVTAVHDNGSGIPTDHHHQIFQPFFTTKTRGSGLGLAISKRIIEAHGGTIRLDPDAKDGARFEITLWRSRSMD